MRKSKWLLLIFVVIALVTWYFLFYKNANKKNIPTDVDMVLAIDVKNNANTLLYYYVTNPSQWSAGSIFKLRKKDDLPEWKDAVEIPDYIFIFHTKNQPAEALYCRLTIKNDKLFQQLLEVNNFKQRIKTNVQTEYYCDTLGIDIIQNGNQLLVGNLAVKDKLWLRFVAATLFTKKLFISDTLLKNIVTPANHFTVYLQKNIFLKDDLFLNGNFKNGQLQVQGLLKPDKQFLFNEAVFNTPDSSLINLAFTQPLPTVYNLFSTNLKSKISTTLNFSIDSLLSYQNKKYMVDIAAIKTRTDSAVSYTYDDDFNKVEKVVVNQLQEPSFRCMIYADNPLTVFDYWIKNKNIESATAGYLFTPIPFVKTYSTVVKDTLFLTTDNYDIAKTNNSMLCIAALKICTNKLPLNAGNYLPDNMLPFIKNISTLNVTAKKEKELVKIDFVITTNNKKKPFLLCFD